MLNPIIYLNNCDVKQNYYVLLFFVKISQKQGCLVGVREYEKAEDLVQSPAVVLQVLFRLLTAVLSTLCVCWDDYGVTKL